MTTQTRIQFDVLYARIRKGDAQAWDAFTRLCRTHGINREQLLDELEFERSGNKVSAVDAVVWEAK